MLSYLFLLISLCASSLSYSAAAAVALRRPGCVKQDKRFAQQHGCEKRSLVAEYAELRAIYSKLWQAGQSGAPLDDESMDVLEALKESFQELGARAELALKQKIAYGAAVFVRNIDDLLKVSTIPPL